MLARSKPVFLAASLGHTGPRVVWDGLVIQILPLLIVGIFSVTSTAPTDIFSSTLSLYTGSDVNTWLNDLPSTYNNKVNAYYGTLGSYGAVPTYGADTTGLTVDGDMVTLALALGEESLQPSNTAGLTPAELANFHALLQVTSVIQERIDLNNWSSDLTSVSNDGAVPDFSGSFAGATVAKRVSCVTSDHVDMLEGTGGLCTDQTTEA